MRTLLLTTLLSLALLSACPRTDAGGAGSPAAAWQPGEGLPPEWPVKQLSPPKDAKIFEGHVDTAQDGGKDITVFFTSSRDWPAVLASIESQLGPLQYLRMPAAESAGSTATRHQAWCSPAGKLIVLLTYDEDPAAAEKVGQPGYFTLLVKQPKDALPVDPNWEAIK